MSNHSIPAAAGDVLIWLVPTGMVTVWCVEDRDWIMLAILGVPLLAFGVFVVWLWRRTLKFERADEARRRETELKTELGVEAA